MNKTESQQVTVYAIQVDQQLDRALFDVLLTYVSPEKSARIKRFFHYEDALRTLLGDIMIRYLLCRKLNLPNHQLQFARTEYGKPFLRNDPNVFFNISHSGQWVVGALGGCTVGVDVEKTARIDRGLARRIFTPEEYQVFITREGWEQQHYFYSLWTLKESFIKAVGKGLSIPLDSFTIRIGPGEHITVNPEPDCGKYFFKQYDWGEAYCLAVCAATHLFGETVKVITIDECHQGLVMTDTASTQ